MSGPISLALSYIYYIKIDLDFYLHLNPNDANRLEEFTNNKW